MNTVKVVRGTTSPLLLVGVLTLSAAAFAQTPPPPPPPGYAPPPGYYAPPPPGYYPPPPGYYGATPVVYPPPPAPPQHIHDGLYLRMHFGVGFTGLGAKDDLGNELTISGPGVNLGVALGGSVAENLVLFGNFFMASSAEPEVTENGFSLGSANGTSAVFGIGPGLAYYIQPINLYVSGTIAATQVDLSNSSNDSVYESKFGLGFQGIVGKEWWVSPEWGLGIAGEFVTGHQMKDKNNSALTWSGTSGALLFSATYN